MAESNFRGPINSMGSLEVDAATAAINPMDGPSLFYQGAGMPDLRSAPFAKDGMQPGRQPSFQMGAVFVVADQIPQARSSTLLAAAQVGTAALAVSLATVASNGVASSASIAVGVPLIPLGTTQVTYVIALDFGFTTGTTVASSSTVVVVDNTLFRTGGWIIVGGAGNSAGTRSLIAQVASISTANLTGITITPAAATGLSSAPIGQANLFGSNLLPGPAQYGPSAPAATAHSIGGAFSSGMSRTYSPREMLARNISVQGVTSLSAYSCVVSGWDVYGAPMTEVITMTAATAVVGKKAFKYIGSITSGTTSGTQTVAFGVGDTFGVAFAATKWEVLSLSWNGSLMVTSNGFTAGVQTAATSTTGDVRGSVMLSTAILTGSGLATAVSVIATNGTGRLFITQFIPPTQMMHSTPINSDVLFGPAQSTATT